MVTLITGILLGVCALHLLADGLNASRTTAAIPAEFEGYYDATQYRRAQQYLQDRTRLGMVREAVVTALGLAAMGTGFFNIVDGWARAGAWGPLGTGLAFFGLLLALWLPVRLPFEIYATFVIEARYGFNRTTPRTFAADVVKGVVLTVVLGGVALAGMLWFFAWAGAWAWCYGWLALTAFQLLVMFVAPVVIFPLFNKYAPLPEGALRTAIETYARSHAFKMRGIFTMDGSRRSTKANALFVGFGRFRRIVLFDTLIKQHTTDELVTVLAHEMGHYRRGHVRWLLLWSVATSGLMFFLLSHALRYPPLFAAFGVERPSVHVGLCLFAYLYLPADLVLSIVGQALSRRFEFAADAFATATSGKPEAFVAALKRLSAATLAHLTPHPLKVLLAYSHPPVLQRIQAIRKRLEMQTT